MSTAGSVLLDTNVVVAHFRYDQILAARLAAAFLHLPWIVLGELYFGAERARRRDEQLTFIRDFLGLAVLVLPDQQTAEHYGRVKAELLDLGKPIPENDIWIAALARQHGLPVATRDAHFSLIPGLNVLAW